jgi:hypothetical protein
MLAIGIPWRLRCVTCNWFPYIMLLPLYLIDQTCTTSVLGQRAARLTISFGQWVKFCFKIYIIKLAFYNTFFPNLNITHKVLTTTQLSSPSLQPGCYKGDCGSKLFILFTQWLPPTAELRRPAIDHGYIFMRSFIIHTIKILLGRLHKWECDNI